MLGRASGRASVCSHPLLSISNQRAPPVRRESSGAVHKSRPAWDNLQREAGIGDTAKSAVHRFFCCHDHYLIWIRLEMNWTSFRSLFTFHVKTLGVNSDFPWTSLHLSLCLCLFLFILFSLRGPVLFQALVPCWTLPLPLSHIWTDSWGWPGFRTGGGGGRSEQEGGGKLSIAKPRALQKKPSTQRIQPKVIRLKNISPVSLSLS